MKDAAIYADTYFGKHVGTVPTSEEVFAMRKTFKKYLIVFLESLQTVSAYKWRTRKAVHTRELESTSEKMFSQPVLVCAVTARVCSRIPNPLMRDIFVSVFEKTS